MRSGAMELFREFAVCTVSPPVVLTTTPIWVSSQPAHGPWANGKRPRNCGTTGESPLAKAVLICGSRWLGNLRAYFFICSYMRAVVNPAVLGVPVSEGGGVRGRAKKTMGVFLVGYCGDVALIITSSRLRCVGGVFLCGCMLVLARAPGTAGGAVYAGGGAAGGGHYLPLSNSRQIRGFE